MPFKLPAILGHRGNRKEVGYENTLEALNHACVVSDGFETDVVLSKDGQSFIVHDTYYTGFDAHYELGIRLDAESKKFANGRRIDELTADDIQQLKLVNGHSIPTVEDIENIVLNNPEKIFDIELKAENTGLAIAEGLQGHSNYFFSSFNFNELKTIRQKFKDAKIGVLFEPSNTAKCAMYPWLPHSSGHYTPFSLEDAQSELIESIAPDYFCINEYDLRPENVKSLLEHYPKARIFIWWYFNEPPPAENARLIHTLHQLQRAGLCESLAGIITDYPAAMKSHIQEIFKESQ